LLLSVYGTIKKTYGNHHHVSHCQFIGNATVHGYKLYDGGFPVASPCPNSSISVEVYDIGDPDTEDSARKTLYGLDSLEGYRKDNPNSSMYNREVVTAVLEDGTEVSTNIYIGNELCWDFMGRNKSKQECPKDDNGKYTWSRHKGW